MLLSGYGRWRRDGGGGVCGYGYGCEGFQAGSEVAETRGRIPEVDAVLAVSEADFMLGGVGRGDELVIGYRA